MIDFFLDKIQVRNVRCYGDDIMEMDFPINNLTVFTGRVGAGKSTIFKSVSMALYGDDGGAKNEKLSIDDLVNEKTGKNLEIHLYFHSTKDNGNEETKYEIHLFHKHSKYNNKLVFVKNGKDISLESKTATYELIEKTLIPSGVYHNTYYFTQQCKNFFTSLSNGEQKDIFNSILDLSEYKQYYENVKQCLLDADSKYQATSYTVKSIKEQISSIKNMRFDFLNNFEDTKTKDIQKMQDYLIMINDLEKQIDKEYLDYDKNADDDFKEIEITIQTKKVEIENCIKNLNQENSKLKDDLENVYIPALKSKYIKMRLERSKDVNDQLNSLNLQKQKMLSDIDQVKKDYDLKLTKDVIDTTSSLEKDISDIKDCINIKKNSIQSLKSKMVEELSKIKDDIQEKINEIKNKKNDLMVKKLKIDNENESYNEKISEIDIDIKKYEKSINEPDAVCSLCGQKITNKEHVQKHIDSLKSQKSEVELKIEENNQKLKLLDNITDFDNQIEILKNEFLDKKTNLINECDKNVNSINDEIEEFGIKTFNIQQKILQTTKEIKEKYNQKLTVELNDLKHKLSEVVDNIDKCNNEKNDIDNNLRNEYKIEFDSLRGDFQTKINNNVSIINEKNDYLNDIKKAFDDAKSIYNTKKLRNNEIDESIKSMQNSILEYRNNIDIMSDPNYYKEMENILFKYETEIKKNEDLLKKCELENKNNQMMVNILNFWKTAFSDSGIKSMLIDAAIPHMNECVGQELDRVCPGKFTVSFDTLSETKSGKIKDKFSINIVNNEKCSTGHKKLSGGEKRIIDLCCMTALRSLAEKLYGKKFHHIFYDEILDSLDDECKQVFCANVKHQSENGCNITLITHDMPEDVEPDRVFPF